MRETATAKSGAVARGTATAKSAGTAKSGVVARGTAAARSAAVRGTTAGKPAATGREAGAAKSGTAVRKTTAAKAAASAVRKAAAPTVRPADAVRAAKTALRGTAGSGDAPAAGKPATRRPAGQSTPARSRAVPAEASTAARPRKTLSTEVPATPRKTVVRSAGPARPTPHAVSDPDGVIEGGGRHRLSAESLAPGGGRHRSAAEEPPARHRAEPQPAAVPPAPGSPPSPGSAPAGIPSSPGSPSSSGSVPPGSPSSCSAPVAGTPSPQQQPAEVPGRHAAARHAQPQPAPIPVDPETGLPPGMTRGILELAAERLAAARATPPEEPEPEPEEPEPVDEAPRPVVRRRSTGASAPRATGVPAAGTRPGSGSRPPLASRPPAGPPEAVRPPTTPPEAGPRHPSAGPEATHRHPSAAPEANRRRSALAPEAGSYRSAPAPEAASYRSASVPEADLPVSPAAPDQQPTPDQQANRGGRRRPIVRPLKADPSARPKPAHPSAQAGFFAPVPADRPGGRPATGLESAEPPPSGAHPRPIIAPATDPARPTRNSAAQAPAALAMPGAETTYPMVEAAGPSETAPAPVEATAPDTAEHGRPEAQAEEAPDAARFWSADEHPRPGLPASVRLPAGLPDKLWHPAEQHVEPPAPEQAIPHQPDPHQPDPVHSDPAHWEPAPSEPAHPESAAPESASAQAGVRLAVPHTVAYVAGQDADADRLAAQSPTAELPVVEIDRTSPPPDVDEHPRSGTSLTPSGRKLLRRRRRVTFLAYVMVVALVLIVGHELRDRQRPGTAGRETAQRAAEPAGGPRPADVQAEKETDQVGSVQGALPADGRSGDFRYAKGRGPILGDAGKLHRFRVAVEETVTEVAPADFAESIDSILGDRRSWIASGKLRLRRVPKSDRDADFTIFLATPDTSERMCAAGGLHTEGFTSCRLPGQVVINAERWATAIPDYAGELDQYREYAINHEVGHQLGHGHESCPGRGRPAPVMLPQTYGLEGCTRNAWPYRDGKRYEGEPRP
ncbi:DUF3152 domain-containing protein [Actinoplanes oblitus]|uniref:DUF3152 domain-containing protein n=1 Tax=Actinoplanes oblitus TaxID=3040509 RepID=A0ABY8WGQ4_9ACTN|nr:DUF3152 domain-containing protein [Actinoplanes oblitus]WIM97059.1 DUF3152 domain-containing protein [Actinoplanes oblitus]